MRPEQVKPISLLVDARVVDRLGDDRHEHLDLVAGGLARGRSICAKETMATSFIGRRPHQTCSWYDS